MISKVVEESCGAIVWTTKGSVPRFLVLRRADEENMWEPPKGHRQEGESEKQRRIQNYAAERSGVFERRHCMKEEKSCGVVVFRKGTRGFEYLLVKHKQRAGGHWSFPKGHVEKGETEEATAIREAREEVGLEVIILPGFREEIKYTFGNNITKTVVFFLAKTATEKIKYVFDEIEDHAWLSLDNAQKRLTFDDTKELLSRADAFLRQNKKS